MKNNEHINTREIHGLKITLKERKNKKKENKAWIIFHRFEDQYGEKLPPKSKTFGLQSGIKNINEAFEAAYKWINESQANIDNGVIANGNKITLKNYIEEEWNPTRPKTATYDRYYSQLRMKEFDQIKNMKISSINLKTVRKVFEILSKKISKRTHETLSKDALDNYKKALSNVFKDAIANNVIESNPTLHLNISQLINSVDSERPIKESNKGNAFKKEEINKILDYLQKENFQLYTAAKIMVSTGLRTQEVVALDMRHSINFDDNYFMIDQAATYIKGKGTTLKTTKTNVSRKVYFNDSIADLLHEQIKLKEKELESKMTKNEIKKEKNLFLISSHREYPNRLYQTQWIAKQFTKYISKLNVPQYQLYSCRHTFATLQLDSGSQPEAIAQSMGHNIETFYKYYVHELVKEKKKVGRKDLLA